jgi:predicted transcriptional regulator
MSPKQLGLVNIRRPANYGPSTLLTPQVDFDSAFEEFDLDERELEVLKLLSSEQNAHFSFQGLRRRLGFHQETLTRTLKRLEEARVIERSPEGYNLKGTGSNYSFGVQTNQPIAKPLINAYLPSQVDVTVLFQKLRGRWFSNFRWLGYSHDGNQLSMSWISEDGRMQLQARIGGGKITIGADSYTNQTESEQVAAAYQLFEHITKVAEEMVQIASPAPVAN